MAEKVHTGMRVDPDKLKKIKYIVWFDRRTFTAVMDFAIDDYLNKWEAQNGPISEKMIEDAKIK